MDISLIWAMSSNGIIGRENGLPWRLPKDMRFFMDATMGKPVIMGRKTFETMKAPLPGRTNIVMTRDPAYQVEGAAVVENFAQALRVANERCKADDCHEIMIIGGAQIYRLGLAVATRLYVTRVDAEVEGDTTFPEIDWRQWHEERCEHFEADEKNAYPFSISTFTRGQGV